VHQVWANENEPSFYLINSEGNLYWSVTRNFCHNTVGVRIDSICINTEVLWLRPEFVLISTLSLTLWSRKSWFATRVRTANIIKVWITLPHENFVKERHDRRTDWARSKCIVSHFLSNQSKLREISRVKVIGKARNLYLLSDNTRLDKVSPCINWTTPIATSAAHPATAS